MSATTPCGANAVAACVLLACAGIAMTTPTRTATSATRRLMIDSTAERPRRNRVGAASGLARVTRGLRAPALIAHRRVQQRVEEPVEARRGRGQQLAQAGHGGRGAAGLGGDEVDRLVVAHDGVG